MFLRAHQVALRPLPLLWWFRPEDSRKLNGRSGSPRARAPTLFECHLDRRRGGKTVTHFFADRFEHALFSNV